MYDYCKTEHRTALTVINIAAWPPRFTKQLKRISNLLVTATNTLCMKTRFFTPILVTWFVYENPL